MTTNVATRKLDLIQQYMDEVGRLLQELNRIQALKITYDSLPVFADTDFTTSLQPGGPAPFPWLDAATFSTGVNNLATLITTLSVGGTIANGTRNTIEAMVAVVPR